MTVVYPVIFTATHDKEDTYLIYIPDIDGATEGYGLKDAYNMARDYMGCTFFDKDDDALPEPSNITEVNIADGKFYGEGESFVSLVDLNLTEYRRSMNQKTVRRNVSIPEWLNLEAEKAHINVSRVLQEALKEKLNIA